MNYGRLILNTFTYMERKETLKSKQLLIALQKIDCFTKEAIVFFHGLHCLNENIKTLFEKALIKRNIINLRNY